MQKWIKIKIITLSEKSQTKKKTKKNKKTVYPAWFYLYKILENAN